MTLKKHSEILKEVANQTIKFGTSIAYERFGNLPFVGREKEGGEPLFMESDQGIIYKLAQSEDNKLMIMPLCRRDGKKIKPHNLKFDFIETKFIPEQEKL